MASSPRYPDVQIRLTGKNGNAFMIIGPVQKALREAGVPKEEVSQFHAEATSGDYDNLLQTCIRWVDVA
jgi:hypothetical protein